MWKYLRETHLQFWLAVENRSMDRVNEQVLNYDLIEDVLHLLLVAPERNETLLAPEGESLSNGSVLVFLPGFGEIRALTERLEANRSLGNKERFDVIPLHSTLSPQDQRRAFLKPRKGCRKVILSTNIAETSVTIPDVVVGEFFCVSNNVYKMTSLLLTSLEYSCGCRQSP